MVENYRAASGGTWAVDSLWYGTSPHSSFLVESPPAFAGAKGFRGNDGNRRLERADCLDVPCATAGTGLLALAGLRGNDGGDNGHRSRSFQAD